ncbi:MAG: hypothetical protein LOD94_08090, partial [Gammaproteobacteria bacterium]
MSERKGIEEHAGLLGIAARAVSAAKATLSAQAARASSAARAAATAARRSSAADEPDERDATIARLEQELGAEQERSKALLDAVTNLEFRLQVLEKSYSKQLADARERCRAAESELAELRSRLAKTEDELTQVTAMRDRLRDMLSFNGRRTPSGAKSPLGPGDNTINQLLSDGDWNDTE